MHICVCIHYVLLLCISVCSYVCVYVCVCACVCVESIAHYRGIVLLF